MVKKGHREPVRNQLQHHLQPAKHMIIHRPSCVCDAWCDIWVQQHLLCTRPLHTEKNVTCSSISLRRENSRKKINKKPPFILSHLNYNLHFTSKHISLIGVSLWQQAFNLMTYSTNILKPVGAINIHLCTLFPLGEEMSFRNM